MTTEEDAFKHNACKKIAQLTRVITDFKETQMDQARKSQNIINNFEKYINQIVAKHQEQLDIMHDILIQYRKERIEDACHEFGLEYKQIKNEYAHLLNEKSAELNNISRESKQISRNIKETTRNSILLAKDVLTAADEFEKDLKVISHSHQHALPSDIKKVMQELQAKVLKEKERYTSLIKALKTEHSSTIEKLRREIKAAHSSQVSKKKGEFLDMATNVKKSKSDVSKLQSDYHSIKKDGATLFQDIKASKNQLNISTKNEYKANIKKITDLKDVIKQKKKCFAKEVEEVKNSLKEQRVKQKQAMDLILKQIKNQQDDIASLEEKIINRRQERLKKLTLEEANLIKERKTEIQERIEEMELQKAIIDERSDQTDYLSEKSKKLRDIFITDLMSNKERFIQTLVQMEFDFQTAYAEERQRYFQTNDEHFTSIKQAFETLYDQSRHNRKLTRKDIHTMKKVCAGILSSNDNEVIEKAKECTEKAKEFDESLKKDEEELNAKNLDNEAQLVSKHASKEESVKETNSKGVLEEKEKIKKENCKHLETVDTEFNLNDEESEHKHMMSKMEARLDYSTRNLENAKISNQKIINDLNTQIVNLDKTKRQYERAHKTEVEKIINQFEVQIQIEQVQLSDKIDKLSTLFDKDENQRGIEIIDGIRKVRQAKNRLEDIKKRKAKELQQALSEQVKKKEEISRKIERLESLEEEKELVAKLAAMEGEISERVKQYDEKTTQIADEMKKNIEKEKAKINENLNIINAKIEEQNSSFEEKVNQMNENMAKIATEQEEKKTEANELHNEKLVEQDKNHRISLRNMKNKIESAKGRHSEVQMHYQNIYNKERVMLAQQEHDSAESLERSARAEFKNLHDRDTELLDEIKSMNEHLVKIDLDCMSICRRRDEEIMIENEKKFAEEKLVEIEKVYRELLSMKKRGYTRPVVYRAITTNTEPMEPIPRSAWDYNGKFSSVGNEVHRKVSIIRPTGNVRRHTES